MGERPGSALSRYVLACTLDHPVTTMDAVGEDTCMSAGRRARCCKRAAPWHLVWKRSYLG